MPWFVAVIDGVPDFRIVARGKVDEAIAFGRCFICGSPLGRWGSFAIGPLGLFNRMAPEPPAHKDCACYAACACPFLVRPSMKRRGAGLPEGHSLATHTPGIAMPHNPGATAVWTTRSHEIIADERGGTLFRMGDPEDVLWFVEGRAAARDEVLAACGAELDRMRALMQAEGAPASDRAALEAGYVYAVTFAPT